MKTPVKIRYERQPRKGAASFIGMVYFDDGSKVPIGDVDIWALPDLPIEHDDLPEPQPASVVSFPKPAASVTPLPVKAPPARPQPLWPLIPGKP